MRGSGQHQLLGAEAVHLVAGQPQPAVLGHHRAYRMVSARALLVVTLAKVLASPHCSRARER